MAYVTISVPSEIVYVAGTINGTVTIFENQNGKWVGYADAAEDNLYHISIECYDAAGNRTEYEETIYYELPWFVVDRTQTDVDNKTKKGFLNASDLNRIERNINTISDMAALAVTSKTDWNANGLPRSSDWERIMTDVARIRNYSHRSTTPETPTRPINHFQKVNDVEQILKDAFDILERNAKDTYYAGEIYAGEGGLI